MSNFWARFEKINGRLFRYDTRIYLQPVNNIETSDICLCAVVGKNPGSAKGEPSATLKEINLDGDKLLPTVRNIFLKAYQDADKELPERSYIQVLNLFYLCEADLNLAISQAENETTQETCQTENKLFPFVWFVWGGDDDRLNHFKMRFEFLKVIQPFYYDNGTIVEKIPEETSSARHTQGLKHDYVLSYISNMLKTLEMKQK